jgi:hypothetical protein
MVLEIEFYLTA